MLYIDDDSGPMLVVRDDVVSDTLYVWLGHLDCDVRDAWLRAVRQRLIRAQYHATHDELDQPVHLAERVLFRAGLHTPDCGDALTVPEGAQAWLTFMHRLVEGADEAIESRAEAAYERSMADYYGGGGPQTDRERREVSNG